MTPTTAKGAGAVLDARVLASVPDAALWRDVLALTKPGIVRMVAVTVAVGFAVRWATAPVGGMVDMGLALAICLIGAGLSAAGANALNQAIEAPRDAQMRRTRERPVASGRMAPTRGMLLGGLMSFLGVAVLATVSGPAPAAVSAATILLYVCIYTPLKPVTALNTIVGAVPGALPPLIGWSAAADGSWASVAEPGGWSIVVIMFLWQIPHFLAIAWKYRDDYARGGYRMLPSTADGERRTAHTALVWTVAMVGASLVPVLVVPGLFGWVHAAVATVSGGWMLAAAMRMSRDRDDASAKRLFIASVIYLPILLIGLVVDALVGLWIG
jgi:protoheme IX farnesyltransferase